MLTCSELGREPLAGLLGCYGLGVEWVSAESEIPGSYWGESEAGLIGDHLFVRDDTPVHSALHEACHYICLDADRRARLHTDAGGECIEENGVCYLQLLLADQLPGVGRVADVRRHGCLGLYFPPGFGPRLVRTGCRRCSGVAVAKRSDRSRGAPGLAGAARLIADR